MIYCPLHDGHDSRLTAGFEIMDVDEIIRRFVAYRKINEQSFSSTAELFLR